MQVVEPVESIDDAWAYLCPVQSTQAATKRRDGDRVDTALPNLCSKRPQAGVDVLDPALVPPMALGWEIDNEPRICERSGLIDKHPARLHLLVSACCFVGPEVAGKRPFELEGKSLPHDADAVDRVDQRFGIGLQNIFGHELDHSHLLQ